MKVKIPDRKILKENNLTEAQWISMTRQQRTRILHRDEINEKKRLYRQSRLEKDSNYVNQLREGFKRHYDKHKEERKILSRNQRLAYFGINQDIYDEMMKEQGGCCAVCGRPPKTKRLSIDHEHQKNENKISSQSRKERIRGLLCHRCNRALGLLGNNTLDLLEFTERLASYIERYYAKRLVDNVGVEEARKRMKNTVEYLSTFEKRLNDNK